MKSTTSWLRTIIVTASVLSHLLIQCPGSHAQENSAPPDRSGQAAQANSDAPPEIQEPPGIAVVPNRPTFGTTGETVQRGVLEIEYGFEAGEGHQNINGLIKFGIFKNLELRFANNPFERDGGVAGGGDSGAGFKYRFVSQTPRRPTVSILYGAALPTATAGLGLASTGHAVYGLVSKDFGKHHWDFNEGVIFSGTARGGDYDRSYFTALDYSHPLRGKWQWTAEIAGFTRSNAATPASMTLMAAATYNVSSRLVLDAGGYLGAFGNLPRFTFVAGVTYAIADLYHHHAGTTAKK